jgi:hypothetical protein
LEPALATAWATIFRAIQFLDPIADARTTPPTEIWPLEDDGKALGKATADYLKSIPQTQRSLAQAFLEKNLPLVMLTVSVGLAVQPRMQASIEHKKVKAHERSMAAQRIPFRRGFGPSDGGAAPAPPADGLGSVSGRPETGHGSGFSSWPGAEESAS